MNTLDAAKTNRIADNIVRHKAFGFATEQPQHVGEGLASGITNFFLGVCGGVASLVGLPVAGVKNRGLVGGIVGLLAAPVACGALITAGAATCVQQVVSGIVNTPAAVSAVRDGAKVWRATSREWVEVRLQSDERRVPPDDSDLISAARNREPEQPLANDAAAATHYEVLGVPRTATLSQIKQAYAEQALRHHPDRNLGDPTAAERFKEAAAAYRVLSGAARRAEYDRAGRAEGVDVRLPGLDLAPHQEMLGGSEFLPWIGHLRLCVVYLNVDFAFTGEEEAEWQRRREWRIAQHLADFAAAARVLEQADGPVAATELFERTAGTLRQSGSGLAALLGSRIGLVASRWLAAATEYAIVEGIRAAAGRWTRAADSIIATARTASHVAGAIRRRERQEVVDGSVVAEALLWLAKDDIVDTVDTATEMALQDQSVPLAERRVRARYLKRFADVLLMQAPPLADSTRSG